MSNRRGPMPTVEFDGKTYSLKSRKTVVPDFATMSRIGVFLWLIDHAYARGYSKPNPLAGFAGAITVR